MGHMYSLAAIKGVIAYLKFKNQLKCVQEVWACPISCVREYVEVEHLQHGH